MSWVPAAVHKANTGGCKMIHKAKITNAFSLYLFIENLNILLSPFVSQPFYCHTICLKYLTNLEHFYICYYSIRAMLLFNKSNNVIIQ